MEEFRTEESELIRKIKLMKGWHWAIIFLLILYAIFSTIHMRTVPNTQMQNNTDPHKNPQLIPSTGIPLGFASVQVYYPEDIVPRNLFPAWTVWAVVVFIMIIIFYNVGLKDEARILSGDEAQERLISWFEINKGKGRLKKFTKIDLFSPVPRRHLRYRTVEGKTNTRKPYEWNFAGELIGNDGLKEYFVAGVNPYDGDIVMCLPTNFSFMRVDVCPNCGEFSDEKVIEVEDVLRLKDLFLRKGQSPPTQ